MSAVRKRGSAGRTRHNAHTEIDHLGLPVAGRDRSRTEAEVGASGASGIVDRLVSWQTMQRSSRDRSARAPPWPIGHDLVGCTAWAEESPTAARKHIAATIALIGSLRRRNRAAPWRASARPTRNRRSDNDSMAPERHQDRAEPDQKHSGLW